MEMENENLSDKEEKMEETEEAKVAEAQVEKTTKVVAKKPAKKRPMGVAEERPEKLPYDPERAQFRELLMSKPQPLRQSKGQPLQAGSASKPTPPTRRSDASGSNRSLIDWKRWSTSTGRLATAGTSVPRDRRIWCS